MIIKDKNNFYVILSEKNMTLIKSISGIRGTIGGKPNNNLTPEDIVKFTAAYAQFIKETYGSENLTLITGRDGRISGKIVSSIANSTLLSMGFDVIDMGITTTPGVELAVQELKAAGGIIFTASHNPAEWNALKLLNNIGEFINDVQGKRLLEIAENQEYCYEDVSKLGKLHKRPDLNNLHCQRIKELKLVNKDIIEKRNFKVVVDGINSSGGLIIPEFLKLLGLKDENIITINAVPDGNFAHNPEPLPEHLYEIIENVKKYNADLGIVVDPDVDRLCFICEDGSLFGEEYTLVAVADYVLQNTPGNTVSNLSSTRALKDVTEKYGGSYFASGVGEVNVVELMKKTNAIIGGEGNGGVIYPESHYGRDALVGIALFLTHLAKTNLKASELRKTYPDYAVSKNKVSLKDGFNYQNFLTLIAEEYKNNEINTADGLRIDFNEGWVHVRKSNTEPVLRIYAEATNIDQANILASLIINKLK